MALYELAAVGGSGSVGTAQAELRAGADPLYVYEVGLFLSAATASSLGLGRPANTPAGGAVVLGQPNVQDDPAPLGGIVASGWGTAPTVPNPFLRRIALPAAIGNGIVWTWPKGLRVKQGTSLVVWNITASAIAHLYFVWEE